MIYLTNSIRYGKCILKGVRQVKFSVYSFLNNMGIRMSKGESRSVPLQAIKAWGKGSEGIVPLFLIHWQ